MMPEGAYFETRLARREADLLSAQRLRYRVFVEELGADGDLVDHENRLERDAFDPVVDHLVLVDRRRPESDLEHVVGVYRLLPGDRIGGNDRFYCDGEYDLSPLRRSGRRVLELGRSCMAPDFRGGSGMFLLWSALAEYVLDRQVEVLFGVASFHGIDAGLLAQPLSWLYSHHLAPEGMRPRARPEGYQRMDLVPEARLDRRAAMAGMPPLIKAYLRLGGVVGEGAFLDHAFNTTDVFLMVDTAAMSARHRRFYEARGLTE